jgi:hypothetical protein
LTNVFLRYGHEDPVEVGDPHLRSSKCGAVAFEAAERTLVHRRANGRIRRYPTW